MARRNAPRSALAMNEPAIWLRSAKPMAWTMKSRVPNALPTSSNAAGMEPSCEASNVA